MTLHEKTWKHRDPDPSVVDRLCQEIDCHPIMATLLVNRGIVDAHEARRTLEPGVEDLHSPESLAGGEAAIERLAAAVEANETISVYGDRDVDGVAGTAVLVTLLQDLDASVGYHIPGKWDGYGVHESALETLARRGTDLVVTVDCGTTACDALSVARDCGMDVIVTDHHPPEGTLPAVHSCLNPHRPDCQYPNSGLCGAGVAFKLAEGLVMRRTPVNREEFLDYALPLTGLATVADRAPLTPENRTLVHAAYERLDQFPLDGFRTVVEKYSVDSIRDFGWTLAPLLNAAREDTAGHLMLQVLIARDRAQVESLLETLESYRTDRKEERREWLRTVERLVTEQAAPETDDVIVLESEEYVGNAPGKIAERYGKPVIAYYSKGNGYRGSVDIDANIDIRAVVEACSDLVEEVWGHAGAPKFFVSADNASAFVDQFRDELFDRYSTDSLRPQVDIDAILDPDSVGRDLISVIEALRPFGEGFDEPRFLIEGLEIAEVERFGVDNEHVALVPDTAPCRCVWWNGVDAWTTHDVPGRFDVVGGLTWDDVRETVSVSVVDLRQSSGEAKS